MKLQKDYAQVQNKVVKLGNNLRVALTGSVTKKVIDLANAPDDTRTVVGPIPSFGPMSGEVFCAGVHASVKPATTKQ